MKTVFAWSVSAVFLSLFAAAVASAHCEIPCGIYDDQLRVRQISEHATTIEKSMRKIMELSKATPVNYNQLVRWISNKETHATNIQHIVSQYFMTQRIKPDVEKYAEKLSVLHQMLIYAMKCKQGTELENVNKLRPLLKRFEDLYLSHNHK
ncbi:MAG: superoxide dismutase [Deltaproteobacteria bacterium]|nr:superoxide dismutase [Deltaproteobacteria bacterium]MBW1959834.1 superoxide dismutase [Deltaproteobacteria bacterium]MBW1994431.1 superoxide dismutase [Deltaproteobacteria bacterium]MBW2153280.1 superoxide dismutase [Deltaproteobacteria bacterium]